VAEADVRASAGLVAGVPLNARSLQEAVKSLFATGQFEDVQVTCDVRGTERTSVSPSSSRSRSGSS